MMMSVLITFINQNLFTAARRLRSADAETRKGDSNSHHFGLVARCDPRSAKTKIATVPVPRASTRIAGTIAGASTYAA
jgi:hypothetical protein